MILIFIYKKRNTEKRGNIDQYRLETREMK